MRNTAETKENEIKALHEQINALNQNFVAENEVNSTVRLFDSTVFEIFLFQQRQKDLEDLQVKIHLQIDEKHQEEVKSLENHRFQF